MVASTMSAASSSRSLSARSSRARDTGGPRLVVASASAAAASPAAAAPSPRATGKALAGCGLSRRGALIKGGPLSSSYSSSYSSSSSSVAAAASPPTSAFDIPAAPILIPPGPWKVLEGGGVCAARGFLANGMAGGLRASGPKADLALVAVDPALPPAAAAGVFTKNVMCAAPVTFCRKALEKSPTARAVLINAGQANAATGDLGYADCERSASELSKALGGASKDESLLLLSTGVIGRRIKMEPLVGSLPALVEGLGATAEDALHAAVAVTTTDLVSKSAALEIDVNGAKIRVGGFAKGSGMIHPNMATMLAVVTTDAAVDAPLWREMLRAGADASFNQISVDGDTSTNDTVIGLASGAAEGAARISKATDPGAEALRAAVEALLQGLAKAVAWDGEGATCLLEVTVSGAATDADARLAARAVASSSLAKAAVFGHDPNWGRIACAAGYSGAAFDQGDLDVALGGIALMKSGQPLEFDAKAASTYLKETTAVHGTVEVRLSLGEGPGRGTAWGCDLSYDYVKINAEYTT